MEAGGVQAAPGVDLSLPYAEQVVLLDKLLHVELNKQMKEESEVRCKRKNTHVMQRVALAVGSG